MEGWGGLGREESLLAEFNSAVEATVAARFPCPSLPSSVR